MTHFDQFAIQEICKQFNIQPVAATTINTWYKDDQNLNQIGV